MITYSRELSFKFHCSNCLDVWSIPGWENPMDERILQSALHCPHCGHVAVPRESSNGSGLESQPSLL